MSLHRESKDKFHPWICSQWFEMSAVYKNKGDDLVVLFIHTPNLSVRREKGINNTEI